MRSDAYPFVAVVGQERVKRALLLCLVNPTIGGVLLCGEKGTAKSTLVRGLSALSGRKTVELPLNVTADRLLGETDLQELLQNGQKRQMRGLLEEAQGQILYADEINLLPEHIVNILLENDRVARTVLVGSMNPEEGALRDRFLDRFGLYAAVRAEEDVSLRCQIIQRRLDYEADALEFCRMWQTQTEDLRAQISEASRRLSTVQIKKAQLAFAIDLARAGNCQGHRTEKILVETAKAIAAWENQCEVTDEMLREAAQYVLPHRLREARPAQKAEAASDESEAPAQSAQEKERPQENPATESNASAAGENEAEKEWEISDIPKISAELPLQKIKKAAGSGRRAKVRSDTAAGRYVKSRIPKETTHDIAIDATLRCAAMHPKATGEPLAITVYPSDIREKIREKRCGATILFCVDASASMGVGRRIAALKGAVLSLLTDAYQKRDTVGILTFRGEGAKLVLPFTRSVDLAKKCLNAIKTGGKTPLAAGLESAYVQIKVARAKDREILPYIILLSDGRGNVALDKDPLGDAVRIAKKITDDKITLLVLDTECGRMHFDFAKQLAERAGGQYVRLEAFGNTEIQTHIKNTLEESHGSSEKNSHRSGQLRNK